MIFFKVSRNCANAEFRQSQVFTFLFTWLSQVRREGEGGVGGHHQDQGERQRGEAEGEREHSLGGTRVAAVNQEV